MASPITHIIFALKILCLLPASIDKTEFIIGTSFPDIRYLAHIDRDVTHVQPLSWHDIVRCTDSFKAGMLFHSLLDLVRIHRFEPCIYERHAPYAQEYRTSFPLILKFAEDAILYDTIDNWEEIADCFDTICDQEVAMCGNRDVVIRWHAALKKYLRAPPTMESIDEFLITTGGTNFAQHHADFPVIELFNDLCSHQTFNNELQKFYTNFERVLTDEPLMMPLYEYAMHYIPRMVQLAY